MQQQALVRELRDVFTLILWIIVAGMAVCAAYLVVNAGEVVRTRAGSR